MGPPEWRSTGFDGSHCCLAAFCVSAEIGSSLPARYQNGHFHPKITAMARKGGAKLARQVAQCNAEVTKHLT